MLKKQTNFLDSLEYPDFSDFSFCDTFSKEQNFQDSKNVILTYNVTNLSEDEKSDRRSKFCNKSRRKRCGIRSKSQTIKTPERQLF